MSYGRAHLDAHVRAATSVLVDTEHRLVLLGRRADQLSHGGTWINPGGAREGDERTVDTALRETNEELGLDITGPHGSVPLERLIGTFTHEIPKGGSSAGSLIEAFYWRWHTADTPAHGQLARNEITRVQWFPIEAPPAHKLHPGAAVQLAYLRHCLLPLRSA